MIFNSFEFLFFFPIVTTLYFILPFKFRWILLLTASCIFYMFFVPVYILILLVTILIDYFAAIYIAKSTGRKKKIYLAASIISTCLVLFVFKYFNFFNDNFALIAKAAHWNYPIHALKILLPIGLSFHTFQSLSYVVEVYRGNQKPETHFGIYSLYVMFYPQLVAGPIERPQNILYQFYEKHKFDYDNVVYGLKLMLWGYFKKIVIADRLSIYVNSVYNNQSHHNGTTLFIATIFFAIQIYCDFSGYSEIAIGSARVMGFKLMTNFNRPYFAKSVSEFWKRWHISLSTWFRDYVYIPLGGNRVIKPLVYFNLFITFLLSGLWHGANWTYVIWGGLNGLYLLIGLSLHNLKSGIRHQVNKYHIEKLDTFINIVITFVLILFSWIFFRANNINDAKEIIIKIIFNRGPLFVDSIRDMAMSIFFTLILLLTEFFEEYKVFNKLSLYNNKFSLVRYATYCAIIIAIVLFGAFDGSQFIYFQF
ncbi:MAG: MBOAT family protein [Mucilaginibacter sp.]|nr:MBOAT family protein [Mucilaginibacter sp.]